MRVGLYGNLKKLERELATRSHDVSLLSAPAVPLGQMTSEVIVRQFNAHDVVYYYAGLGEALGVLARRLIGDNCRHVVNAAAIGSVFAQNKVYQSVMAHRAGISIPRSYTGRKMLFQELCRQLGVPFVAKAARGMRGDAVYLVHTEVEYEEMLSVTRGDIIIQEYVPNDGDYRVFVIGNQVHGIFKRVPAAGSFKANYSLGGSGQKVASDSPLRPHLCEMALRVTRLFNVDIAGIDIMRSTKTGTLFFIEINTFPAWRGLDATTGLDTTVAIADYLERRCGCSHL